MTDETRSKVRAAACIAIVAVGLVGCGSSSPTTTNANFSTRADAAVKQQLPTYYRTHGGGTTTVTKVACHRSGETESYSCPGAVEEAGVSVPQVFAVICTKAGVCTWTGGGNPSSGSSTGAETTTNSESIDTTSSNAGSSTTGASASSEATAARDALKLVGFGVGSLMPTDGGEGFQATKAGYPTVFVVAFPTPSAAQQTASSLAAGQSAGRGAYKLVSTTIVVFALGSGTARAAVDEAAAAIPPTS